MVAGLDLMSVFNDGDGVPKSLDLAVLGAIRNSGRRQCDRKTDMTTIAMPFNMTLPDQNQNAVIAMCIPQSCASRLFLAQI